MEQVNKFKYLQFIPFKEILQWDLKRHYTKLSSSKYPTEKLQHLIVEEKQKYDISDKACDYGILGVNNHMGIFDAYIVNGSKIKQKYKRMEMGWIAYNPYRVNIGSIGLKRKHHKNDYISPAYVVFSCTKKLLSEYLFILMKTPRFNDVIKRNTTGSVRQNLSYEILKNLSIPLPLLAEQKALVTEYNAKMTRAAQLEKQVLQYETDIKTYVSETLGINIGKQNASSQSKYVFLKIVGCKNIEEWGFDKIFNKNKINSQKYKTTKIKELCNVGSGGTPSRSQQQYYKGNIPWIKTGEVLDDVILDTEEHITQGAINNSSAKIYPQGSLIIAMYGQGNTRGRTARLGVDATTNQACAVLFDIDNNIVITDYLWYYLQVQYDNLRSMASGNNQPNLNADKIKNYNVVIPPIPIQREIVEYINVQKEQIKKYKLQAEQLRTQALMNFENQIFNKK